MFNIYEKHHYNGVMVTMIINNHKFNNEMEFVYNNCNNKKSYLTITRTYMRKNIITYYHYGK